MGTEVHLPPKFSFSSDFGHFVLKMLENAKFSCVKKKRYYMRDKKTADFSAAGDTSPVPPALDAHIWHKAYIQLSLAFQKHL